MKMPAQMKQDWCDALESGKYQQGFGRLRDANGGYCCLGVLQQMVSGKLEQSKHRKGMIADCPTPEWYKNNGIEVDMNKIYPKYLNDADVSKLMNMNDGNETDECDDDGEIIWAGDKTFPEIAAWIREHVETI